MSAVRSGANGHERTIGDMRPGTKRQRQPLARHLRDLHLRADAVGRSDQELSFGCDLREVEQAAALPHVPHDAFGLGGRDGRNPAADGG